MIPNKNKEQIKIIEVSRDGKIKIDKQDQYRVGCLKISCYLYNLCLFYYLYDLYVNK